MRVAVIADIHGNGVAFDAVLADLSAHAVDRIVCLGDAIQGGPQPAAVVARLRELGCPVVYGNADAFLLTGESGAESLTPQQHAARQWSLAQLSEQDRAFIAAFPPTVEISLPGDRRLLCFHGSPTSFDDIIFPETPEEEVRRLLDPYLPANLTGGHTHLQQIRRLDDALFFNPGSVGYVYNTRAPGGGMHADPWAEYAILLADERRFSIEFCRVPFDVAEWKRITLASGIPDAATMVTRY
ncbi:MAG: metallophosphatase family protein [Thermomicrobia bacterium]|nr:metallophosphatase family protein [Thermomicrobia bacterium]MCA1725480.1 metallophosphatase family protein [Thermomicrobia bacterium]